MVERTVNENISLFIPASISDCPQQLSFPQNCHAMSLDQERSGLNLKTITPIAINPLIIKTNMYISGGELMQ
jgi:hypothetical protein